jgi:TIR domain-containing protein
LEFFLTYSTKDKRLAGQAKKNLEERGQSAFLAHEDIQPSVEWEKEIRQRLDGCTALVAIVTRNFSNSAYANQEVGFVLGKGKPIVALRFSDSKLPGFLQSVQAMNASTDDLASQIGKTIHIVEERLRATLVRPSRPTPLAEFVDSIIDRRRERYWRALVRPLEPYDFIPASAETDKWLVSNTPHIFTYLATRPISNGMAFERNDNGQIYAEVRTNGEIGYAVSLSEVEKIHLERATQVTGNTMEFASKIYQHFPHEQNRRGHVIVELKLALAHQQAIRCNQIPETLEKAYVTDEPEVIVQRKIMFDEIVSDWRGQLDQMMVDLCRHFGLPIEMSVARKVRDIVIRPSS